MIMLLKAEEDVDEMKTREGNEELIDAGMGRYRLVHFVLWGHDSFYTIAMTMDREFIELFCS